jgi:hypothetical protein
MPIPANRVGPVTLKLFCGVLIQAAVMMTNIVPSMALGDGS